MNTEREMNSEIGKHVYEVLYLERSVTNLLIFKVRYDETN